MQRCKRSIAICLLVGACATPAGSSEHHHSGGPAGTLEAVEAGDVRENPVAVVELRRGEVDGHNEVVARVHRFEIDSGCVRELEGIDPRGARTWEVHDCREPDRVRTVLAELLEGVELLAFEPRLEEPAIGRQTSELVLERADGSRWSAPALDGGQLRLLGLLTTLDRRPEPTVTPSGARSLRLTRSTTSLQSHTYQLDAAGNWTCAIVYEGTCATRPHGYCFDDVPHSRTAKGRSPSGPAAQLLDALASPDHGPEAPGWSVFVEGVDERDRPATMAALERWNGFAATLDPSCIIELAALPGAARGH